MLAMKSTGVVARAWSSLHHERGTSNACSNHRARSAHCGSACSKTWRCAVCDARPSASYIRFRAQLRRLPEEPPDTATAEDIRRFQVHQRESGVQPPTINCSVSALRFFFTVTLDRPDLSRAPGPGAAIHANCQQC